MSIDNTFLNKFLYNTSLALPYFIGSTLKDRKRFDVIKKYENYIAIMFFTCYIKSRAPRESAIEQEKLQKKMLTSQE